MRAGLLGLILGPMVVVLTAAGAVVHVAARARLWAQFDGHLTARLRTFASLAAEEWPDAEDPDRPIAVMLDYDGGLNEDALGMLLYVAAGDGTTIVRSPEWPAGLAPDAESPPRFVQLADGRPGRLSVLTMLARRDEDAAVPADAPPPPRVIVAAIAPADSIDRSLAALAAALAAGGGIACAGTVLAVWLGVARGLRPVARLRQELDRSRADALPVLSSAEAYPGELRPVLEALHRLLRRIADAVSRERRFTDAVAHELRTPIAELRSLTDVAARWPEPERLRRTISEARGIADEMESLMESLLAAARRPAPADQGASEHVALLPLIRSILIGTPNGGGQQHGVLVEGDDGAEWFAPRGAIAAILRNLIDNACEYTPNDGAIRIAVSRGNTGAALTVENGPVALGPEGVEHMFEPFWRAAGQASDRAHHGLGLAIVAALCESLALRCEATLTPDLTLRIAIAPIPVADSAGHNQVRPRAAAVP